MRLSILALALALTGCAAVNDMDSTLSDFVPGVQYAAPTLGGYPRPSGCQTSKCQALDQFEAELYNRVRTKKITWVNLVDRFYNGRAELYPNSSGGYGVNELRSYQRALAEQMDLGKMTESQWAYFIEKKSGEINSRNQALSNSAPRTTNCTTTNVGTTNSPQFSTTCR